MENKRTQINIRLSDSELEKVKISAEVMGLSVGKYAKQVVLKSRMITPTLPATVQSEAVRQLAGMANNLNQLTRLANQTGIIDLQAVQELRKEVHKLWQQLEK